MRTVFPCFVLLACVSTDPATTPTPPTDAPPTDTGVDPPTDTDTGSDTDTDTDTGTIPEPARCDEVACHYVREGGAGDGSDWSAALPELPGVLERGHVYLIAAGTYPGYVFDDPAAGTDVITVQRATAADHGTDDGWDDAFDGTATFGPIAVDEPHYVVDGRGRGLVVRGEFEGTAATIDADDVTLASLDIDGAFVESGGQHAEGSCTALDISGENVVVSDSEIHDAADDGVVVYDSTAFRFEGNEVHALHGCGTDGGCGPCYNGHSDGLELFNVVQSEITRNLIYDINSTATVFFGNWGGPDEYNEDLLIANNLFYAPEVGLVVYIHYANRVQFLHNVVWGVRQGSYGGLSVGPDVTDLDLYDNILLSVNFAHTGGVFDPNEHRGSHNVLGVDLGQWVASAEDIVAGDPGFTGIADMDGAPVDEPVAADFVLRADSVAVDAGTASVGGVPFPVDDYFGTPRADGLPDIGAIEVP